jgi:hypothetical protein
MAEIKKGLPTSVALRHEDRFTSGIPDISVSLNGKTSWWEVKVADPSCRSKEIQKHLCRRLNAESFCRYVIYRRGLPKGKRPPQIIIVPPLEFERWQDAGIVVAEKKFNHASVVLYMAQIHGVTS